MFSGKGDFFKNSQESYGINKWYIFFLNKNLKNNTIFVEPKKVLHYYILQCLGSYSHILTQSQIIIPY